MTKCSAFEKRINKLMPPQKEEPVEYIAIWGGEEKEGDVFIAEWGSND